MFVCNVSGWSDDGAGHGHGEYPMGGSSISLPELIGEGEDEAIEPASLACGDSGVGVGEGGDDVEDNGANDGGGILDG